ncbi:methyl-accepting chemotaxis protein [Aromatoleum anaerobium]|nr:methyl-accepting chemotaxis protein [Aromatoleum anaerobium]
MTLLYVVIISAVLAAFGGLNYYQASKNRQAQIDKELDQVTGRVQISLPGILWNLDQEQLQKVLVSEAGSELVDGILISDESGKVSGGVVRENGQIVAAATVAKHDGPSRQVSLVFNNDGKPTPVGTATVFISTETLDQALRHNLLLILGEILVLDVIIVVALYLGIRAVVVKPLLSVKSALQEIAQGEADLTKRLSERSGDEFAEVAHWFNVFIARLQGVFRQVSENSALLAHAAEDTLHISDRASGHSSMQKQMTEQMAEAVGHLTEQVGEASRNASIGSDAAAAADQEAKKSRQVLTESMRGTQELAEHMAAVGNVVQRLAADTTKIEEVLRVIGDIADQTNLLALNAAIEAARAGEQGRGFAVVADEVRKLAERTTHSTHEIQDMVGRIKEGNRQAVEAMNAGKARGETGVRYANQAQTVIDGILDSITRMSDLNGRILAAANSQNKAVEGISGSIDHALRLSDETVEVSRHAAQASEKLERLAGEMRRLTEEFKT